MKILGAAVLLVATLARVQAYAWITGLRNHYDSLRCSSQDCTPIDRAKVTLYYLQSHNETVPYSEVLPSQDRFYWRCSTWDYEMVEEVRQCFFAPPVSW